MKKIAIIFSILFTITTSSSAQWWQSMGPGGGSIHSHLQLNDKTLLGTACGVYSTTNQGLTFQEFSKGIPAGNIMSMIEDDGVIIACIQSKGLYRSTDGGITWNLSKSGNFLRQDTFGQQRLLRLGDMTVARNYGLGDSLYFSSDEGMTWQVQYLNNSLFNNVMSAGGNLFTYNNNGTLGAEVGIYRSGDMGQSWTPSNTGLPAQTYPANIYDLNGTLYLITDHLYSSVDGGNSWTQVSTSVLPALFGTGNYFPTWTILHEGRFYSQNGGNTYLQVATWMPGESGWQLVPEIPSDGNTLTFYALGATPCLSRQENQFRKETANWETFQPYGINNTNIYGLFGSGDECLSTSMTEIRQITDDESQWTLHNASNISDLYNELYSVTRIGGTILAGSNNVFSVLDTWYSTDNAQTWTNGSIIDINPQSRFLVHENEVFVYGGLGGTPYVFGLDQTGVIVTNYGSPYGYSFDDKTVDLVAHDGELFALTSDYDAEYSKILRWDLDGGTFWQQAAGQINGSFFGAKCLTSWQGDLYVGLSDTNEWDGGVYRSADNGATWSAIDSGIEGIEVNRFLVSGDSLFAATESGVFVLENGSNLWEEISGNLPVGDIAELARTNWYLYARLDNGGVWRLSLTDEVSIANTPVENHSVVSFPNPCNDKLYLNGLEKGIYQVSWSDTQGKLIRQETAVDVNEPFNTSDLAPGAYLLHISREGFQHSLMVIVH